MKLSDIGHIYKDIEIIRDGDFSCLGLTATRDQHSMLAFLENDKYIDQFIGNASISCGIVTREIANNIMQKRDVGIAIAKQPKLAFFTLHNHLVDKTDFYGSPSTTVISPSATVHPTAWVSEHDVLIGDGCIVGPHVTIHSGVTLGKNVTIGANTVLGGEGFECFRYDNKAMMVRHAGGVQIANNVDIQASCCVDKGLFDSNTVIGEYTKIDNMVHVAHNVVIGRRVFIAACAMLAGRVIVADDAWIGPGASLRNGMAVGPRGFVSIGAVATRDVDADQIVSGNFAIDHQKFLQFIKTIR